MGRYLGLDPGERRIGVAVSDPSGTIASPHSFVDVGPRTIDDLRDLCASLDIGTVVIGLPVGLDGSEGPSARRSRQLGDQLNAELELDIEYHDERFTTVTAEQALLEGNVSRRKRKGKRDQVAAAVMLQGYLDGKKHAGRTRGDDTGR